MSQENPDCTARDVTSSKTSSISISINCYFCTLKVGFAVNMCPHNWLYKENNISESVVSCSFVFGSAWYECSPFACSFSFDCLL